MTDLVAFLEARLAEEQELAENADAACWHVDYCDGLGPPFHERFEPARVLAEIAAKRAVIGLHHITEHPEKWGDIRHHPQQDWPRANYLGEPTGGIVYSCEICDAVRGPDAEPDDRCYRALPGCETLLALAALYADHGGFDESWRT